MDSKKRFNKVKWRMFVPMLVIVLTLVGIIFVYQYIRERHYHQENLNKPLEMINTRIIEAYNADEDIEPYLSTLSYYDNTILRDLRVSVFTRDGKLLYSKGLPLQTEYESDMIDINQVAGGLSKSNTGKDMFYFARKASSDNEIFAYTAMPFSVSITDALKVNYNFWILMSVIIIAAIIAMYIYASFAARNVVLLNNFATKASKGELSADAPMPKFPNNELGEISKKIVNLYIEKEKALRRIEKEHQIAIHAIEEKASIKRRLTNNINHELKTPVSILKGYIETILSNDMDEATRTHFLMRAQAKVNDLCTLLQDVSTMTRLEESADTIPITTLNFHDLVFNIDNDIHISGVLGNMTFEYDIPNNCIIRGNATLLTGAITNLIKNAVHHSRGTDIRLECVSSSDRYYTFVFSDDGVGVGEEHLSHLFERFYRVDAGRSRKAGGTGLGLPIVKNVIEALGGSISVHNRTDGGLKFIFTLEKSHEEE